MTWWQKAPAFTQLNLRFNPFGELDRSERGRLAVVDLDSIRPGRFQPLQIIADSGHGKTTHLLALMDRTPGAVYEYVPEGADHFLLKPDSERLFLLDEAQRVRRSHLQALFRAQPWLVLGTHDDLSGWCPYPLRTLRLDSLLLEKLQKIVEARIRWALDKSSKRPFRVPLERLEELRQRHGANLRAIEDELYDWFQRGEFVVDNLKPDYTHGEMRFAGGS